MDAKTIFLNSLYDEQMGFFCAHEYSENLEELLKDELNVKQFNLYKEWKKSEAKRTCNHCSSALDLVNMKLDRIESILEKLTDRLEAMEEKPTPAPMTERITGMEKILGEIITRFDATEQKTNKVNDDFVKSLMEQNKKTEMFQENLLARLKVSIEPTRQEEPEEPRKESQQSIKKEKLYSYNRSVEIIEDYSNGDVHVKKGEIYGFLASTLKGCKLVNITTGETIGVVP